MVEYSEELASLHDYSFDFTGSLLENPELMYASADADGSGFGIAAAGVALLGATYLAYSKRVADNDMSQTEESLETAEEMGLSPDDIEEELEE